MKRYVLISILIGILCLTNKYAFGQISEGGEPLSFSLDIGVEKEKIPVLAMVPVDVKSLLAEDERLRAEKVQRPFRFGYAIDVDIDIKKDGVHKKLPSLVRGSTSCRLFQQVLPVNINKTSFNQIKNSIFANY